MYNRLDQMRQDMYKERTIYKAPSKAAQALATLALAIAWASPVQAAQVTTDPGDYMALPPGTDLVVMYGQFTQRERTYVDGNTAPIAFSLDTNIGLARYIHYLTIGGYTANVQAIVPFGNVRLRQPVASKASGAGDLILGSALWLLNDREAQRYFVLSTFLSTPTGAYSAARGAVNVGENRWKATFHTSYIQPVAKNWMLDLTGEATVFGNNNDFIDARREQDPQFGVQAHLRYILTPSSHVGLSYYHDFGASSTIAGISQSDRLNNSSAQLTYANFITPSLQLQAQYGQGLKTRSGPKEAQRINLRVLKAF